MMDRRDCIVTTPFPSSWDDRVALLESARGSKAKRRAVEAHLDKEPHFCGDCFDSGCSCGGIGMAHHGPCCSCTLGRHPRIAKKS